MPCREGTFPLPELMNLTAEVVGLLDSPADCSKLLYAPLSEPLTFRQTRRYTLEYSGSEAEAKRFIEKVLVEEHEIISQHRAAADVIITRDYDVEFVDA